MARKKPIISPLGQWAYPGEVTIIPSSNITMKGVNYPVLGIDDLGNQQMMMPGQDYTFPGNYVTEYPQMGKGGLAQWFDEKWVDVKTGKACGRSGKDKDGRPYPACRPSKRVNETTPKTTSEMSSSEKAKFKREKTSGKRIDYNHKRRQDGGEEDSTFENFLEFVEPTGMMSWDDASRAYDQWKKSNATLPSVGQALDMFGAVPGLGKFGKIKYLADPDAMKAAYKYIPWQDIVNIFDTVGDETSKAKPPVKKEYGGWLEQYQSGGSFTNLLKLAMTPEVRGIVANQLVDKGVTKVAQKVGDSSKQQIFDRYRPVDYPTVIGAIVNSGKDVPLRDLQGDYHVSEEAWRLALGLPTKSKYISPSKYRPTKASDPNAQYYSLNNVYDPQKLIDAYIQKAQGKPGQTVQMDALSPYIINQDMMTTDNEIPFTQTDPLQKFSLSQGEDERGRYISIYDKYDFNVPHMDDVVYGSNRKPYEFYDRFYYKKDAAGKPVYVKQKKQGGQTNWLNKYK